MRTYFIKVAGRLSRCDDHTPEIVKLTGYGRTVIKNWCAKGNLQHLKKGINNLVPKVFLVDFFCSLPFHSITRKTP
ncbi:MAG TPA: hypothetical protein VHO66_00110 [Ruminiclostridium sp.]|nr:hypothetical protein [Ruminiclostridium sp.]